MVPIFLTKKTVVIISLVGILLKDNSLVYFKVDIPARLGFAYAAAFHRSVNLWLVV